MKIIISGAGIGGLTAAYWLDQYGYEVEVIEKLENFQHLLGYAIDFWGPGFDVAEKMGLLSDLLAKNFKLNEFKFLNDIDNKTASFDIAKFRKLTHNRVCNFLRGDLESALFEKVKSKIKIYTGVTIQEIVENANQVLVILSDGTQKKVDCVIGADGVHSNVRKLVFGNEDKFSHYMGYQIAAFIQPNNIDIDDSFYAYSAFGKQVSICPIRNNKLATFFIYKSEIQAGTNKQTLHEQFASLGWVVPKLLENLNQADEVFLDEVKQIKMPVWHKGHVVLLGDACQCLTLMSGQGASMAMAGAYTLSFMLDKYKNLEKAFSEYESWMKPDIILKQKEAQKFICSFVPETKAGIDSRSYFTRQFFKNIFKDNLKLPG